MSALSRSSSSRPRGTLRCVERCWPSAAQARRSDTPSSRRTCSMQTRRRAGLRSFPGLPPAGSACPASGRQSLCAAACSQSEILQSLDLIALETAKLLAPAVVRDLRNPNRAYRVGNALPLRHQHIHLAQLRNNLLGLVSLPRHRGPPWLESHTSGRTTSKGEDQTPMSDGSPGAEIDQDWERYPL